MWRRALTLSTCVALAAGACGGGDSRLSKAEFITQADAICDRYQTDADALAEPGSEEELLTFLEDGRALLVTLRDDLGELRPPEEDEAEVEEMFGTLDVMLDAVDDATEAAEAGDTEGVFDALGSVEEVNTENDEALRAYGFEVCGEEDEDDDEVDPDTDSSDDFDIDAYPPVNNPSDDDVAAFVGVLEGQFGGLIDAESLDCIARFVLERATVPELSAELGEKLGEAAAYDCLTLEQLLEIGQQQEN